MNSKNIIGYFEIQTSDDENYIIDFTQSNWVSFDVEEMISFVINQIKKRKKKFGLFIKTKKYTNLGEEYEKIFSKNNYDCVQNQIVLTNSSAKVLHEPSDSCKYTVLSNLIPTNPAPIQYVSIDDSL